MFPEYFILQHFHAATTDYYTCYYYYFYSTIGVHGALQRTEHITGLLLQKAYNVKFNKRKTIEIRRGGERARINMRNRLECMFCSRIAGRKGKEKGLILYRKF